MNLNPPNDDGSTAVFAGQNSVAIERVRARARELSLLAGRPLGHVTPIDFEQAKREVLGGQAPGKRNAGWASAVPFEHWNLIPAESRRALPPKTA